MNVKRVWSTLWTPECKTQTVGNLRTSSLHHSVRRSRPISANFGEWKCIRTAVSALIPAVTTMPTNGDYRVSIRRTQNNRTHYNLPEFDTCRGEFGYYSVLFFSCWKARAILSLGKLTLLFARRTAQWVLTDYELFKQFNWIIVSVLVSFGQKKSRRRKSLWALFLESTDTVVVNGFGVWRMICSDRTIPSEWCYSLICWYAGNHVQSRLKVSTSRHSSRRI